MFHEPLLSINAPLAKFPDVLITVTVDNDGSGTATVSPNADINLAPGSSAGTTVRIPTGVRVGGGSAVRLRGEIRDLSGTVGVSVTVTGNGPNGELLDTGPIDCENVSN
jgi:hypothetical protein